MFQRWICWQMDWNFYPEDFWEIMSLVPTIDDPAQRLADALGNLFLNFMNSLDKAKSANMN